MLQRVVLSIPAIGGGDIVLSLVGTDRQLTVAEMELLRKYLDVMVECFSVPEKHPEKPAGED